MLKLRGRLVLRLTLAMSIIALIAAACCLYLGTAMRQLDIKRHLNERVIEVSMLFDHEKQEAQDAYAKMLDETFFKLKDKKNELESLIKLLQNEKKPQAHSEYFSYLSSIKESKPTLNLPSLESLANFLKRNDKSLQVALYNPYQNLFYQSEENLGHIKLEQGLLEDYLPLTYDVHTQELEINGVAFASLIASLENNTLQVALLKPLELTDLNNQRAIFEKTLEGLNYPLALSLDNKIIFLNTKAKEIVGDLHFDSLKNLPSGFLASTLKIQDFEIAALSFPKTFDTAIITALVFAIAVPIIALIFSISLIFNFTVTLQQAALALIAKLKGDKDPALNQILVSVSEFQECEKELIEHDKEQQKEFDLKLNEALDEQKMKLIKSREMDLEQKFESVFKPKTSFLDLEYLRLKSFKSSSSFINFLRIDQDNIAFYLGDCLKAQDKALSMALAATLAQEALLNGAIPSQVLNLINLRLHERALGPVALTCGILNEKTGNFMLSSADFVNLPLICTGEECHFIEGHNAQALGVNPDEQFINLKGTLVQQDRLIILSDQLFSVGLGSKSDELFKLLLQGYKKTTAQVTDDLKNLILDKLELATGDLSALIIRQNTIRF